jgi:hypothetical protein
MVIKFEQFLNENLYQEETFYKLVTKENWNKIQRVGAILPLGKVPIKDKLYMGNWAIPKSNLQSWTTEIKYFGSPLQALLMKRAPTNDKMVLIEFTIDKNNKVYNRDITKMFINYSFKGYFSSFSDEKIYPITESFIGGIIKNFKFINEFTVPTEIGKFMAEPKTVLDFTYGKNDIIYTDKKMESIKSVMFKILLKKIFTFDFKNF